MNTLLVNGVENHLPADASASIGDLLVHLRDQYAHGSSCISSIQVDGIELTEENEDDLSILSLSQIKRVEVQTAHPRELADDTLQALMEFSTYLERISRDAAAVLRETGRTSDFPRLTDGIETFLDALQGIKQILKKHSHPGIQLLEKDLSSILQDLLDSFSEGRMNYVATLLGEYLCENMKHWRESALPSLMRSRDS